MEVLACSWHMRCQWRHQWHVGGFPQGINASFDGFGELTAITPLLVVTKIRIKISRGHVQSSSRIGQFWKDTESHFGRR